MKKNHGKNIQVLNFPNGKFPHVMQDISDSEDFYSKILRYYLRSIISDR